MVPGNPQSHHDSTWAIGDVHGCHKTLQLLLSEIKAANSNPKLIFVGDLVGKGNSSLQVLQLVHDLGNDAQVVLGNHDLHLLAVSHSVTKLRTQDQLESILDCNDWDWRTWLENQPLALVEEFETSKPWIITHAGVHPTWSVLDVLNNAKALSNAISQHQWDWYRNADTPLGLAAEVLTRMRTLDQEGKSDGSFTAGLETIPANRNAWFDIEGVTDSSHRTVSGHWAAVGIHTSGSHHCIDSGCVYGGSLAALRLDDSSLIQIPCQDGDSPAAG